MININELIEVKLRSPDDFLKIKETLTRIGIASKKEKTLYQSCHILHKQGKYYIVHFKEMFLLDGKSSNFSDDDRKRRNTIINLLHEWELLDIVDESKVPDDMTSINQIKIIPYKEKGEWTLVTKYTIGKKRKDNNNG